MKTKPVNYLYNFYNKDDGDGTPIIIDVDGFKVQIGINVVILPGFYIKPCKERAGQITIVGSNSFLGKGESLEEGSVSPEGTILQGEPLFDDFGMRAMLVADDFGRTPENNDATLHCLIEGFLHHVSFMVNRNENSENAIKYIERGESTIKIGFHFNLTEGFAFSRLSKDKWYSVNEKGNFGRTINSRRSSFFLLPREKKQIQDELAAQISSFKTMGLTPRYFDSHGNVHFKLPIAKVVVPIIKAEGFEYIRIPRAIKSNHRLYDWLFKRRVIRLYKKAFRTADEFLNASDLFSTLIKTHRGKTIEIMVHPYIKRGRIINRRDVDFGVLLAFFRACSIQLIV